MVHSRHLGEVLVELSFCYWSNITLMSWLFWHTGAYKRWYQYNIWCRGWNFYSYAY